MAELEPKTPAVVSQKGALVGDDNVAEPVSVEPEVNSGEEKAQVAPRREADSSKVVVHETRVVTDKVITDPSSPEAVQVPDAGRGDASLPIHRLAEGTPEEVFASEASDADESDNDGSTAAADKS